MQVRPIYHWLSTRVKAHVFLCMLAYYVEHHMRVALAPLLFADHEPEKRERVSIVRPAEPSAAAKRKIARRQRDDAGLDCKSFDAGTGCDGGWARARRASQAHHQHDVRERANQGNGGGCVNVCRRCG